VLVCAWAQALDSEEACGPEFDKLRDELRDELRNRPRIDHSRALSVSMHAGRQLECGH
jgi:hypothetical protein